MNNTNSGLEVKNPQGEKMAQDLAVVLTSTLAEARDSEPGQHLQRTKDYMRVLADKLKDNAHYSQELTPQMIEMIVMATPLHDIGKVGLPDRVLLNPGRLSEEEFDVMKTHTTIGKDILEKTARIVGSHHEFLAVAIDIAYTHQEKWDGSGYPRGLQGSKIPLCGRMMAIVDVYDALISRRLYRPPVSHEKAVEIIFSENGQHFDPGMVETFVAVADRFQEIYRRYPNTDADLMAYAERLATDFAEQVNIVAVGER